MVVYGGRGALGTAIVTKFKESGWWVANIDMKSNEGADENILVEGDDWVQQVRHVDGDDVDDDDNGVGRESV